jgi:hypothetical protein
MSAASKLHLQSFSTPLLQSFSAESGVHLVRVGAAHVKYADG